MILKKWKENLKKPKISDDKLQNILSIHHKPNQNLHNFDHQEYKALLFLQAPVKRVTGYDVVVPYFKLEKQYIPSQKRILDAVQQTMEFA